MQPLPFDQPVFVTRPLLPDLAAYADLLRGPWQGGRIANGGPLHDELERALSAALDAPHLRLINNGTTALMLALRGLGLADGEAITTPLTAPATVNAIRWCGLQPVFADIDPDRLTLSPAAVDRAVTPRTAAIVGVHVYGIACDVAGLAAVAQRHRLPLIYDGAHAFGTRVGGASVTAFGDATALSFHATKIFTTGEGGAVATADGALAKRIESLRNFGVRKDFDVAGLGLNGKMSELNAALGLAGLPLVAAERRRRAEISQAYVEELRGVPGLRPPSLPPHELAMLQYFPLRIEAGRRDRTFEGLKQFNVFARKYFQPLCSETPLYRGLPSSAAANLPVATEVAAEILCLPLFGALGVEAARRIACMVRRLAGAR
jgi:dTDP-4-amino-4,6-dideoxygalactose transaminase